MNIYPAWLGYKIAESIKNFMTEARKPVVVYPGRFQPFHAGHYSVYQQLVKKFGPENVYIATSDITNPEKSPFSFEEKRHIISKLFGIPPENIVQVKNPYAPAEIVGKFPEDTPLVVAMSEKDSQRLGGGGKYYEPWSDKTSMLQGYKNKGYYMISPEFQLDVNGRNISGTAIRSVLGDPNVPDSTKRALFQKMYGKFDPEIYDMIVGKLTSASHAVTQAPVKKKRQPADKQQSMKLASLLKQKIRNPETGNTILVATALKYPKDTSAYRAAMQFVKARTGKVTELTEGGAAGHMAHPYEDVDLKFEDLENMVNNALVGDLGGDASEKLDGQNIMFTVRDGRVIFARNKSDVKNRGEKGMDAQAVRQKFGGRGELESSFGEAAEDLQAAIDALSPQERDRIFANGRKFVNVEIINSSTKNTIPYGKNVLIFHNAHEFDENGELIGIDKDAGKTLSDSLKAINADRQKTYGMQGPNFIVFSDKDSKKFEEAAKQMVQELESIRTQHGLPKGATLGQYKEVMWRKKIQQANLGFSEEQIARLAKRWAYKDKTAFKAREIKDPQVKKWFREIDNNLPVAEESVIAPIKKVILKTGAMALARAANLIAAHNAGAGEELKRRIAGVVKKVQSAQNSEQLRELERQMEYLRSLGIDSIVPSEGIVFMYNGRPYKFTGAFAPMNRILGMVKYAQGGGTPEEPSTQRKKASAAQAPSREKPQPPMKSVRPNMASLLNKKIVNPLTKNNIQIRTALKYPPDHPAYKLARQVLRRNY